MSVKSNRRKQVSIIDNRDITEIWDVSKSELMDIQDQLHEIGSDLDLKHKGKYFDYQVVDDLFDDLSDVQKAKIFIYGQWIHHCMYKRI